MMIKKNACISMLIGLSSLVNLLAATPIAANSEPGAQPSAQIQSSDGLRQGIPGRRIGGGTRSDRVFSSDYATLMAMLPSTNLGVTTAAQPALLFAIPEMVSDNTVEFVLRDRHDALVYETTFEVAHQGGLVKVETAALPSALNLNEDYQWYFSIVPNLEDRANDVVVHGSLRRVDSAEWFAQPEIDSSLAQQIAIAPPLLKAQLYQQANLWHDAALILANLYQAEPKNPAIAAAWYQFLQAAGLESMAQAPSSQIQISLNQSSLNHSN
jgi:hypothetical protein